MRDSAQWGAILAVALVTVGASTAVAVPLPVIEFTPAQPLAMQFIRFDARATAETDPARKIVSYRWDFGDGDSGGTAQPVGPYRRPGLYTITLTVTNDAAETATATKQVRVLAVTTCDSHHLPFTIFSLHVRGIRCPTARKLLFTRRGVVERMGYRCRYDEKGDPRSTNYTRHWICKRGTARFLFTQAPNE